MRVSSKVGGKCKCCGDKCFIRRDMCRDCSYAVRVRSVEERFWSKVDKSGECWLWTAGKTGGGYGHFHPAADGPVRAHRLAYEMVIGPIPEGMQLDHLCRVRHCVNPAHLEPVTNRENALRGMAPSIIARRTGKCSNGHQRNDLSKRCPICVKMWNDANNAKYRRLRCA